MKRNTNAVYTAFKAAFESSMQEHGIEPSTRVPWHPCTPEYDTGTNVARHVYKYTINA